METGIFPSLSSNILVISSIRCLLLECFCVSKVIIISLISLIFPFVISSMGEFSLPNDCAIYIAQRIRSNIRELEGALKRVVANARFTNQDIDLALVKDALKDLFVISAKMVSVENIQKTVAEYYNIKLSDLLSKRRSRSITRPRQMAMALTKELTNHSLPEIGEAYNGRDHTTVLHACKKIKELRKESPSHEEDYRNLNRALTN